MRRWVGVLLGVALGVAAGIVGTLKLSQPAQALAQRARDKLARMTGAPEKDPAWIAAPGYRAEIHARGFSFPSRIVPAPTPPASDDATAYWVAELSGTIRAVARSGATTVVAEHLLDFERASLQESGLLGLDVDPTGRLLFLTLAYWDSAGGAYRNRVDRLALTADGRSVAERTTLLDMHDEMTVASYQIQFVRFGPDGRLWVGVGMGANPADAQDLGKFAGKILHMDVDGHALPENPFFDASAPKSARSYVWAFGFRNPFDLDFDPVTRIPVVSDVGPGIDRILRLTRGVNYLFGLPGGEEMMRANALFTWGPGGSFAPTGVALKRKADGSGSDLYVGLFGAVYDPGVNTGKRIFRFELDEQGQLSGRNELAIHYGGKYFDSVTDIANVHGQIYFADLYGASDPPHEGKGLIYRLERTQLPANAAGAGAVESGDALFASYGCASCHDMHPADPPKEGPVLEGLAARLDARLASPEYAARLADLGKREGASFVAHRERYAALQALSGRARTERWFREHVRDPRFDHPEGKMPGFPQLSDAQLDALAKYLLAD